MNLIYVYSIFKGLEENTLTKLMIFGTPMYIKILRAARFKKGMTLMKLLPWDKGREHMAGLRPAQKKAVAAFKKAGTATAGLALSDRMEIIGKALAGKDYGGIKLPYPYPKLSPTALKAKIEVVRALV